jgi:arabinan endo-1,5-alpha-L-arabinosidase
MSSIPRRTLLAGTGALAAGLTFSNPAQASGRPKLWKPPDFADVSVHDPDLVRVGGRSYVFGSHAASASTRNLLQWEQITGDDVSPGNPLFDDVITELAEAFAWSTNTDLWAPGVARLPDGRFYYYYCSCEGSSPLSAMGVAVADDVLGPYRDRGLILRSGMVDEPSEDGTPYDSWVHPNVIDADPFVDARGDWWMVYGSFSGGIYLLRLNPRTGKPQPGQGYGRHLMGGNHARIEGPAIMYHPDSRWYYLFVTFGGLDARGGYNIRVARSRTPEGPWRDISGTDMSTVRADPDLPIFDDVTIAPHGTKIAGNHQFTAPDGTPGTGYVSPGGCTPWYDRRTGDSFIAFHTRFPGTGEFHQVRTHRMIITDDGWPVILPFRYAGEQLGPVPRSSMAGPYALVRHEEPISPEIAASTMITLERNGRITGAAAGCWRKAGPAEGVLEIDGMRYSTVFARQWDPDRADWSITFSGLAATGTSVWAAHR